MPVLDGLKSASEKFAGAARTYSIEALMGDGRAMQAGTSHNLGQNFAKAFGIQFQGRDKELLHAWTTSWGVSTRLIGGVIMTHGDDSGLVLPPRVAPIQVVIVPIPRGNWQETVLPKARDLHARLTAAGVRAHIDAREEYTPGWKFAEWELRGVPLRLEIGPKDIEKGQVVLARRDTREKLPTPLDGLEARVRELLDAIQQALFERALRYREEHTVVHRLVRRVQGADGGPARLRARALVRIGGVRGRDQSRDAGHDPESAVRRRGQAARASNAAAGDHPRQVREGLLSSFSSQWAGFQASGLAVGG